MHFCKCRTRIVFNGSLAKRFAHSLLPKKFIYGASTSGINSFFTSLNGGTLSCAALKQYLLTS
jgi:hypothetical protein